MDGLSAAASIIAVIQLSSSVVGYINAATGAKEERLRLREGVQSCDNILQQLKDNADGLEAGKEWSKTIEALEAPGAPLGRLWTLLNAVETKLQPKNGVQNTCTALKWPWKCKEVDKIIAAIEREKTLLSLALSNRCGQLTQDIKKSVTENTKHLLALIKSFEGNEERLAELSADLLRIGGSQAGLKDGIDRLNHRNDHREATEEHVAILNWLSPADYGPQQSDFLRRRQPGTGQWFLDTDAYQTWLQMAKKTLFCPGIPGAGKTILTAIAVDQLTTRCHENPDIGLAYIYCNFRRQGEQKADDLLASLLKQLSQTRSLPTSVRALHDKHNNRRTRPSFSEISQALQSVIPMYSRVFVVLDALDECQKTDNCRDTFLLEIFSLQTRYGMNILATSRFIPEVISRFRDDMTLEIRANTEDVKRYVGGHLDELPDEIREDPSLRKEITTKISDAADGMYVFAGVPDGLHRTDFPRFLLAQIYLDSLNGKGAKRSIRHALEWFQKQKSESDEKEKLEVLDRAYGDAMERINGQNRGSKKIALDILSWITFAKRPLTVLELQHALAVEVGQSALDEENILSTKFMLSTCAGLVTVDEKSEIIRLVHYTTQEYFQRTHEQWFPDAETHITRVCVSYLSLDVFGTGSCTTAEEYRERLRSNPFYKYAACHWGRHALQSAVMDEELNFLQANAKVEAAIQPLLIRAESLSTNYRQRAARNMTGLHLVAHLGLEQLARVLLNDGTDVDAKAGMNQTPLSLAAKGGN